jgi:hypothetical protein
VLNEPVRIGARVPYAMLCTAIGLVAGWLPVLFHGPIPEKFDFFYLNGALAVWAWYATRLLIGFVVGISAWPARWYLRGPLCGALLMVPPGFFALATPNCGAT